MFSLTPLTLQLDEEQSPTRTITVVREPGLFGTVQINWRTVLDPQVSHTVTVDDLLVASLGGVSFPPNVTTATIELQLRPNSVRCVHANVCERVCVCVHVTVHVSCACMCSVFVCTPPPPILPIHVHMQSWHVLRVLVTLKLLLFQCRYLKMVNSSLLRYSPTSQKLASSTA